MRAINNDFVAAPTLHSATVTGVGGGKKKKEEGKQTGHATTDSRVLPVSTGLLQDHLAVGMQHVPPAKEVTNMLFRSEALLPRASTQPVLHKLRLYATVQEKKGSSSSK
jgi:hypothetical protein